MDFINFIVRIINFIIVMAYFNNLNCLQGGRKRIVRVLKGFTIRKVKGLPMVIKD